MKDNPSTIFFLSVGSPTALPKPFSTTQTQRLRSKISQPQNGGAHTAAGCAIQAHVV